MRMFAALWADLAQLAAQGLEAMLAAEVPGADVCVLAATHKNAILLQEYLRADHRSHISLLFS